MFRGKEVVVSRLFGMKAWWDTRMGVNQLIWRTVVLVNHHRLVLECVGVRILYESVVDGLGIFFFGHKLKVSV